MESYLASTIFTTSGITKAYCLLREISKTHLSYEHCHSLESRFLLNQQQISRSHYIVTISSNFINSSFIYDSILSSMKVFSIGYTLWRGICGWTSIKNLIFAVWKLCKRIKQVMIGMILTNKKRLGPNIWLKTSYQVKNIKT